MEEIEKNLFQGRVAVIQLCRELLMVPAVTLSLVAKMTFQDEESELNRLGYLKDKLIIKKISTVTLNDEQKCLFQSKSLPPNTAEIPKI